LENVKPLKGTMQYKNPAHKFIGTFKDGKRSNGKLIYSNGMVYEGDFERD
jgi:hypothetical protein